VATLSPLTWIGNAAAVLTGAHGAVTAFAHHAGCSRQVAYTHAQRVLQAVSDAQLPGPSRAGLLADNQHLRQQLLHAAPPAGALPPDTLRRLAVTAHALGLSLNQIEDLLALLPGDSAKDRSSVGRWVQQAARAAGGLLEVLDRHGRPLACALCLDEIFFHGTPVLVAVEPASMALLHCRREADRSGETWRHALQPFTGLQAVVRDAGSGLSAGLAALDEQRRQAQRPALDDSLDVFHTHQEAQRLLGRLWRGAEKQWGAAEEADRRVAQAKRHGYDARGPAAVARAAWAKAFGSLRWYLHWEGLWRRAAAALELFRPDGRLNDRAWAEAELAAVCAELGSSYWRKLRGYLQDRRALNFLDRLQRRLAQAEPRAELRAELVELWRLEQRGGPAALEAVQRALCAGLSPDWGASYGRVGAVLEGVVRASSAVECVNSILRMHQGRQRTVTQGLLDLKRLYWNLRDFRSGKRRGRCPYELLGLALPSYDFWEILHTDPQELERKLSTGRQAA
jgi:hypothetical protein